MHLKQLFEDEEIRHSPWAPETLNIPWTKDVIRVLEQAQWRMRWLPSMSTYKYVNSLVDALKGKETAISHRNFIMQAEIDRYGNNSNLLEPLREIYFPELDVPEQSTEGEFHTDDKFDNDHMLLGFEFIVSGAPGRVEIECVASLADTNHEIQLPPQVKQYVFNRYVETLKQINAGLVS